MFVELSVFSEIKTDNWLFIDICISRTEVKTNNGYFSLLLERATNVTRLLLYDYHTRFL